MFALELILESPRYKMFRLPCGTGAVYVSKDGSEGMRTVTIVDDTHFVYAYHGYPVMGGKTFWKVGNTWP